MKYYNRKKREELWKKANTICGYACGIIGIATLIIYIAR